MFSGESLGLKAVMVAVDYTDILSITLPYNRHHFKEVWIVTDAKTWLSPTFRQVIGSCNAVALATECFYDNGAHFNKWLALEQSLDIIGRQGWICLMDADVLWPKVIPNFTTKIGYLYTPLRRMLPEIRNQSFPPEQIWDMFPIHRNIHEWAGYSQIFHGDDPYLGPPPWHETNWLHAGGADSFFQRKWPQNRKIRPPFECLHLGPSGINWCGRVSPYTDGTIHPLAEERHQNLLRLRGQRRKGGNDPFRGEKF